MTIPQTKLELALELLAVEALNGDGDKNNAKGGGEDQRQPGEHRRTHLILRRASGLVQCTEVAIDELLRRAERRGVRLARIGDQFEILPKFGQQTFWTIAHYI